MILAPLRGVTIRCFRETMAAEIAAAGFDEAITPFVPAMPGVDPLKDRELQGAVGTLPFKVTPQFIGKHPAALKAALERVKAAGYDTVDFNAGCPFPMVRNKGRGSGILRTPDTLRRMLAVGCETLGAGKFSVKVRLGVDRSDELRQLLPIFNEFPLRWLAVHARTARQMYAGECDRAEFEAVRAGAKVPVVYNGDVPLPVPDEYRELSVMVGRGFIRQLGARADAGELLRRYVAASQAELSGDRPVLGRLKELLAYWRELPAWSRKWPVIKLCRTVEELLSVR